MKRFRMAWLVVDVTASLSLDVQAKIGSIVTSLIYRYIDTICSLKSGAKIFHIPCNKLG